MRVSKTEVGHPVTTSPSPHSATVTICTVRTRRTRRSSGTQLQRASISFLHRIFNTAAADGCRDLSATAAACASISRDGCDPIRRAAHRRIDSRTNASGPRRWWPGRLCRVRHGGRGRRPVAAGGIDDLSAETRAVAGVGDLSRN
jgi:hypothetical protein